MAKIYQTKNFIVESFDNVRPFVTRTDGGHVKIYSKKKYIDRTQFSPKIAIEFIRLTMIVGEAMRIALTRRGIKIMRINYQDMGNWAFKTGQKPYFHMHIFGRAKNAKYQPYHDSVYLPYFSDRTVGFYKNFKPLNTGDIKEIKKQIELIFKKDKYNNLNWSLK